MYDHYRWIFNILFNNNLKNIRYKKISIQIEINKKSIQNILDIHILI